MTVKVVYIYGDKEIASKTYTSADAASEEKSEKDTSDDPEDSENSGDSD